LAPQVEECPFSSEGYLYSLRSRPNCFWWEQSWT